MKSPVDIHFELTYACNLFCKHCYNHYRHNNKNSARLEGLTEEHFASLTQKIIDAQVFRVILTGGEPFLRRNVLYDTISMLNKHNVSVSINSNLTLINDEDVQELRRYKIFGILTSLHSHSPEKHDKITCVKGSHKRALQNIKKLKQDTQLCVSANMVVSKENIGDVYNTGLLLKSQGIEYFTLTPMAACPTAGEEHSSLKLSKPELASCLEQMLKLEDESAIKLSLNIALPKCFSLINERYSKFLNKSCTGGLTSLAISPYGYVKTCIMAKDGIPLDEKNIPEVYSEIHSKRCSIPEPCKSCAEAESCRGGCKSYITKSGDKSDYASTILKEKIRPPIPDDPNCSYQIMDNLTYRKENGAIYTIFNFHGPVFFFEDEIKLIRHLSRSGTFNINSLKEMLKPIEKSKRSILIDKILAVSKRRGS